MAQNIVNVLMCFQALIIVGYAIQKEWAYVAYWLSCLTINYVVTYKI